MKTWKIISIVVAASIVGFGIVPLQKVVKELKKENQELSLAKQEKKAEYEELTSNKKDGVVAVVDPEDRIPRKLAQTELLIDLQKIASQTSIQLPNSWSFSVTNEKDLGISELNVMFSIKGSRGNIYKFLQLLEGNKRILAVEQLAIKTFYEDNVLVSEMMVNLHAFSQEKYGN